MRARARGTTRTDRHHERRLPLRRGDGHARRGARCKSSSVRPRDNRAARRHCLSDLPTRASISTRGPPRPSAARAPRRSRPRRGVGKSGSTAALCADLEPRPAACFPASPPPTPKTKPENAHREQADVFRQVHELARRIRRHKVANRQCLVVKYAGDTRYEDEREAFARDADVYVITHDRQSLAAVPCVKLADVSNIVHAFDVVGVDEGQFFGDLAESCEAWARAGKTVIVAALDATFQREPFNDVLSLVPIAEQVTKLSAVCAHCGDDAAFTKRVNTASKRLELIGGAECRRVVRRCFDATSKIRRAGAARGRRDVQAARAFGLSPVSGPAAAAAAARRGELHRRVLDEHAIDEHAVLVARVGEDALADGGVARDAGDEPLRVRVAGDVRAGKGEPRRAGRSPL